MPEQSLSARFFLWTSQELDSLVQPASSLSLCSASQCNAVMPCKRESLLVL